MIVSVGPVTVGSPFDTSGAWTVPLAVLLVLLGVQLASGDYAARDRTASATLTSVIRHRDARLDTLGNLIYHPPMSQGHLADVVPIMHRNAARRSPSAGSLSAHAMAIYGSTRLSIREDARAGDSSAVGFRHDDQWASCVKKGSRVPEGAITRLQERCSLKDP